MLTAGSISLSDSLVDFFNQTGFAGATWGNIAMILVAFLLLYLAIKHKFEPLLLFTIAFGMLLTNLPGANMFHSELFAGGHIHWGSFIQDAGLLDYLYLGVKLGIYPCLIFIGVGAMTDFGPLIANPKSFMLGDCDLPDRPPRARIAGSDRRGRLLLYGPRAGDSAAHHASADHQERA